MLQKISYKQKNLSSNGAIMMNLALKENFYNPLDTIENIIIGESIQDLSS